MFSPFTKNYPYCSKNIFRHYKFFGDFTYSGRKLFLCFVLLFFAPSEALSSLKLSFCCHSTINLQNIRPLFKTSKLCSKSSCDPIQWFQWLQVVINLGHVTLVWCHMHISSHKCLEVLIISTNVLHKDRVRLLYICKRYGIP